MGDQIIELGLSASSTPVNLVDRLLSILSEAAVEDDSLKTGQFRAQLEECRRSLNGTATGTADFARVSKDCLTLCEDYFQRSRHYLIEKEREFAEMIHLLREALSRLAGESGSFNSNLMLTSDRLGRLSEIQDIRELKKQISLEVRELKRVVEEKQKQDEASFARLEKRVETLQSSLEESREEASLDGLTQIANRRTFDRAVPRWVEAHAKTRAPFVLALLDIDHFKEINDKHGHQVGDGVLLCAAQWFSKCVRSNDFLGRFGGDEFAVLLSNVTGKQAHARFTELVERISASSYDYKLLDTFQTVNFTVSCGLAELAPDDTAETLLRRADQALYTVKNGGRNRVALAESPKKGFWKAIQPLVPFKSS